MNYLKDKLYFPIVRYFSFFSSLAIKFSKKKVIMVTGSSGKSGLVSILNQIFKVNGINLIYKDHINSAFGIPMSILSIDTSERNDSNFKNFILWFKRILFLPFISIWKILTLKKEEGYYLFEADSDRPGEIRASSKMLKPDISIWLNTGLTHAYYHDKAVRKSKNLTHIDSISEDFSFVLRNMKSKGFAIINEDDENILNFSDIGSGVKVKFGKKSKLISLSSFSIEKIDTVFDIAFHSELIPPEITGLNKTILKNWEGSSTFRIKGYLVPDYFYYTLASIMILSAILGISKDNVIKIFDDSLSFPPGRMSVFEGIKHSYIVDSSYNAANTVSVQEYIRLISIFENNLIILGDMREQGSLSKSEHEKLAQTIIDSKIGRVILVGKLMNEYTHDYLINNGFDKSNLFSFESTSSLKHELTKNKFSLIPDHSMILIKGSQNEIFLESIVEILLKNKQDTSKLCRRGNEWDYRRLMNGL